jgi:hypothetical protein
MKPSWHSIRSLHCEFDRVVIFRISLPLALTINTPLLPALPAQPAAAQDAAVHTSLGRAREARKTVFCLEVASPLRMPGGGSN